MSAYFSEARKKFHNLVFRNIVRLRNSNIPNFADKHSKISCEIAKQMMSQILE